jgi:regulator of protease activity HflC (stomatin/prohibitin superfamily)
VALLIQEKPAFKISGFPVLAFQFATAVAGIWCFVHAMQQMDAAPHTPPTPMFWASLVLGGLASITIPGLFAVQPNESRVVTFAGGYAGTVLDAGFWWTNPFTTRARVSMRVRNFISEKAKVNDRDGNPVEIAAVVVWEVTDAAKALFAVDAYERFVAIQAETAIRGIATRHPYDTHIEGQISMRGNPDELAAEIKIELQHRLEIAGVNVRDARISHLAYAPEIAHAMLRRQQATAIVAARAQIVEGAVGMVELALNKLSERNVIVLDEERKAAMVSNLLVVLVGDSETQPIINAGSLY